MSLLEKASLIVTPNAYKTSKLYSVVPNTTLGDMDVVRATTATRVNSAGLIEVVPRNLLTYSNDFTNAAWNKDYAIITPNATTSPDGTNNGTKLIGKNINDIQILYRTLTVPNGNTVFSFYVKKAEYSKAGIRLGGTANNATIAFDLDLNAIIYQAGSILSSQIIDLSNDWKRIILTVNITNEFAAPCVFGLPNSGYTWDAGNLPIYTGNGTSGIYIYGAQLEQGSTATEYFPTTTRLNIPRIDYTNGSCPSLLVEPQRTNLFTYSDQFDNVAWSKFQATVTANNTTSPEGISTADKLESSTNGTAVLFRTASTGATASTISVYAKAGTNDVLDIGFTNVTDFTVKANLTTGTITSATSGITGTITNVGNGWYKVTATRTMTANGTAFINSATSISGRFIYIWGAQLEVGSYATSYIPTVASTVTRNADVISKTGISSLIGQTEGTLYVDANISLISDTRVLIDVQDGTNTDVFQLILYSNTLICNIYDNGNLQSSLNSGYCLGRKKIALSYKQNDFIVYINGVQAAIDTSGTVPSTSVIAIGYLYVTDAYQLGDTINSVQLYKTRLSNSELAQLTTL